MAAQELLPALSGRRRTWFCGAYHGFGFHEDGLASGLRVAGELGAPW
jgi:predicted NAD/FAD-binding protein